MQFTIAAWRDGDRTIEIDGRRHYEAQIVVGVLADEIDAPRRAEEATGTAEHMGERLPRIVGQWRASLRGGRHVPRRSGSAAIVNDKSEIPAAIRPRASGR